MAYRQRNLRRWNLRSINPITEKMEKHYEVLKTKEGFIAEYWRMTVDYQKFEDAYEAVERKYTFAFGRRKYANYNSFRNVRDKKVFQPSF